MHGYYIADDGSLYSISIGQARLFGGFRAVPTEDVMKEIWRRVNITAIPSTWVKCDIMTAVDIMSAYQ